MLLAGILFDIGVVLTAGAQNLYMLMAGRVLLGVAVAFASVSVTLYNSEMAPAQLRGRLNQLFQVGPPGHASCCVWRVYPETTPDMLAYPAATARCPPG